MVHIQTIEYSYYENFTCNWTSTIRFNETRFMLTATTCPDDNLKELKYTKTHSTIIFESRYLSLFLLLLNFRSNWMTCKSQKRFILTVEWILNGNMKTDLIDELSRYDLISWIECTVLSVQLKNLGFSLLLNISSKLDSTRYCVKVETIRDG